MKGLTRRIFMGVSAAALATRSKADPPSLGEAFHSLTPFIPGTDLAKGAKPYRFREPNIRIRATWNTVDQSSTKNILTDAYTQMGLLQGQSPLLKVSLARQAWLHDYVCSSPDDSHSDLHLSWLFLPWHRGFVYFHEKMIREHHPDFRLPAWDWSSPDGQTWPSFYAPFGKSVPVVEPAIPNDALFLPRKIGLSVPVNKCTLQGWMVSNSYADFLGTAHQGGGAYWGPHAYVHARIGGLLADPTTAALDPLFYTHHCNIDRFFAKWCAYYPDLIPKTSKWLNTKLYFYDTDGSIVSIRVHDLLDTGNLGYRYDLPAVDLYRPGNLGVEFQDAVLQGFDNDDILSFLGIVGRSLSYMQLAADPLFRFLHASPLFQPLWFAGETATRQVVILLKPLLEVLPLRIQFAPKHMLAHGFYVFGLSSAGASSADALPALGGFGIFTGHDSKSVTATICVQSEHLEYILAAQGKVQVGYGIPRDGSDYPDQTFTAINQVTNAAFVYPTDPQEFVSLFGSALSQISLSGFLPEFRF